MNSLDASSAEDSMHLDLLTLDELRTRPPTPDEQSHLGGCGDCTAELDGLRELARDIRATVPRVTVPPRVDRAILRRPRWTAWIPFAAACAAIVLVAIRPTAPRHPDDLDRSGRVDIVDAYLMAKRGDDPSRLLRSLVVVNLILPPQEGETRFSAIDVFVNADGPLAAWQLELATSAKIVGIEGGDGLFKEPPTYDSAALNGGRIAIAGMTMAEKPPAGRVRVARLHLMETGSTVYTPKLVAAGGPGGVKVSATVELGGAK